MLPSLGLRELNRAAAIPGLNREDAYRCKLLLPPVSEQRRIAAILDQAHTVRALRREALLRLNLLAETLAADLFAEKSPVRPLRDVAERVTVGHVGPTSSHFVSNGVPFLRTGNVGDGVVRLSDLKFITAEFHDRLKKSQLRSGDVLISRVVSDEVRCAVLPAELHGANCANVIVVTPSAVLRGPVLVHFLRTARAQAALMLRRVGSAQSVVNTKVLQELPVPVPSVSSQEKFCALLAQVDWQRSAQLRALAETDGLAVALQKDAFSGSLVRADADLATWSRA